MSGAVAFFRKRFKTEGNAGNAPLQRAYMKSALQFHGVTQPQTRAAVRDYVKAHPLDHDALIAAVDELFASEWFDLHSAAIGILERRRDLLGRAGATSSSSARWPCRCWASANSSSVRRSAGFYARSRKSVRRWCAPLSPRTAKK